jgi:hypothetical protein
MWLGTSPTYKDLIQETFTSSPPNDFVRVSDPNNTHTYIGSVYEVPIYDFADNNGGWFTTTVSGSTFVWEPGRWYINGNNNKQAFLTSPSLTNTAYKVVIRHKWNFNSSTDYGQIQYSINNGTNWITVPVGLFRDYGYNTANGWSGTQNTYIDSEFFINVSPSSSSILFRLRGVWGNNILYPNPNWEIASVSIEGLGNVRYAYQITQYPITNNEYCLFLNSIDRLGNNPNVVYVASMSSSNRGGITLATTGPKGYRYRVKPNMGNKPVNFINWWRAARYCNWLHNGGKKYKTTDNTESAPQNTGAYNIGTSTTGTIVVSPQANAKFTIPTIDEWIKAGYYMGGNSSGYWTYPTQYDTPPECVDIISSGGDPIISPTHITYLRADIGIISSENNNGLVASLLRNDALVATPTTEFLVNTNVFCDTFVATPTTEFLVNTNVFCDTFVATPTTEFLVNTNVFCDVLINQQ